MKRNYIALCILLIASISYGQINVTVTVNTNLDRTSISQLIYGSNGQSIDWDEHIAARRMGGNRLTGYNWETNASHAGADWFHNNDNYLPWVMNLSAAQSQTANNCYYAFHDTSLAMNCYSLITIPMAGYVSADENGPVSPAEAAPSVRFKQVVNTKGSAFSLVPDTSDGYVYIDECLNNLIQHYGSASAGSGVHGYSMDNEYALWISTHPRIHPAQPTIAEVIQKSRNLSRTIKTMDADADVSGPACYGYASFLNFQSSPDWNLYSSYGNYINAYLHGMKLASDTFGTRLLDILDVHWYPEAQGINHLGTLERVVGGSNDRGVAIARMQCPRSLWDSSYVENSWIGQWFSPCVYVHALKNGIANYYPGTKLAFTEFNYGGEDHISGGIAISDVLGLFGKYGVHMSNYWGALNQYVSSAYKIYRNYDGNLSPFGDLNVRAATGNILNSSVYASLESLDTTVLHLVMMNKNYDSTLTANISVNANTSFTEAEIWSFDSNSIAIINRGLISNIQGNQFSYNLPPLSVCHFVLRNSIATTVSNSPQYFRGTVFPNPSSGSFFVNPGAGSLRGLLITDVDGRTIRKVDFVPGSNRMEVSDLSPGIYFCRLLGDSIDSVRKIIVQ